MSPTVLVVHGGWSHEQIMHCSKNSAVVIDNKELRTEMETHLKTKTHALRESVEGPYNKSKQCKENVEMIFD